jgi:hypothetical protein
MANLTRAHIEHLHGRVQHLHKRATAMKERAEEMTEKFVRTLEVSAGAMVAGVVEGKAGPDGAHVMGVPVNLGGGLALNVLGYFGAAGKQSHHLNNLGDGMLAAYVSSVGFGIGSKWRTTGKLLGGSQPATAAQGTLSDAQMAQLVERIAARQGGQRVAQQPIPQEQQAA